MVIASRHACEVVLQIRQVLLAALHRSMVIDDEVTCFRSWKNRPHCDFRTPTVLADTLKEDLRSKADGVITALAAERIDESRRLINFDVFDAISIITTIGTVHRVTP